MMCLTFSSTDAIAFSSDESGTVEHHHRDSHVHSTIHVEGGSGALEVVGGGADAFLYDRFSILRHHAKRPEKTRVIDIMETFEPYAVAMRPGDYELWRSVNLFIEKARWDGRYDAIHKRHFGTIPDDPR